MESATCRYIASSAVLLQTSPVMEWLKSAVQIRILYGEIQSRLQRATPCSIFVCLSMQTETEGIERWLQEPGSPECKGQVARVRTDHVWITDWRCTAQGGLPSVRYT
jgi:hypothetical protein